MKLKLVHNFDPMTNTHYANDQNTYDGAPDGNRIIGTGHTKLHATLSLIEQLFEEDIYTEEELLSSISS